MTIEEWRRVLEKKNRGKSAVSEHDLQVVCVRWARLQYPKLIVFAIPNGAWCGYKQGRKLVAEGMQKGIPDLCIALPRKGYHGLFIEMKAGKRGVVRDEQTEMMIKLKEAGYCCAVCRSFEQFQSIVDNYIK